MKQVFYLLGLLWTSTTYSLSLAVPATHAVSLPDTLPKPVVLATATNTVNVDGLLPTVTPKSPTVAALGRYGEHPVSFYTRLPTIEIPLCEFTVGDQTIPIKLTYHAAGLRVGELPSWVGLGWSLQTGGMITRNVLSRPDEQNGLLGKAVDDPNSFYNSTCVTVDTEFRIAQLADNNVDGQRDVFSYRTPSGSNSFMLLPGQPGYAFLRAERTQILPATGLSSFTMVATDGIRYRFSDRETTNPNATGSNPVAAYTSAWHLSEIISATNNDRAVYTYSSQQNQSSASDPQFTWVIQGNLYEAVAGGSGVTTGITSRTTRNSQSTVQAIFPTQIDFPGGRIQFVRMPGARADGTLALDYVDLLGYDVTSSTYKLVKRFDLVYANQNGSANTLGGFLSKVNLLANDGNTIIGSYGLTYNQTVIPASGSLAKDFWGYFNGQITNNTLIASKPFTYYPSASVPIAATILIGDATRTANETLMQAGILTGISYPTGGLTQFDYQAHRYLDNTVTPAIQVLAGGLRVWQVRSYTGPGNLATTRRYTYGAGETGNGSYRSLARTTYQNNIALESRQIGSFLDFSYVSYVFSSASVFPLTPEEGAPVTYPQVTEYREDGAGGNLGKTIYTFRDAASDAGLQLGNGRSFYTSKSWDRGQPLTTTVQDVAGNLRSRITNGYAGLASGTSTQMAGLLVVRTLQQLNVTGGIGNCLAPSNQYRYMTYPYQYGLTVPTSAINVQYDDDNSGRFTQSTEQTDYDPTLYQPRERRTLAEGGIVLGTEYYYPQDYKTIATSVTTTELLGMRTLQDRNSYKPIETVHFRRETLTAAKDYKTGQLMTYAPFTLNSQPTALLKQIYVMESVPGTFTNAPYVSSPSRYTAAGGGNSFPYTQKSTIRLLMDTYSATGYLTRYTLVGGASTSFLYNTYTPTGGVPFSVVSSQTTNDALPTTQTTTYTYRQPLLGPASLTDPRGVTTSYQYDTFGRLLTIKDKDGYILKNYSYHYPTGQ
ncbi:RHS repeat domain-containing protein [Spirosoma pollinicola]|uniref:Sugar-binding protein n=1 Tax=Spirosoma pollinicola TaxID=2057025 RepID=A0A2K8YYM7_9BACT|nr:RHS repeat domain-containing protein [Spirosoma pollinicola]AUD02684.1 hypothetical protein CWM47_13060 [Spirosoma pollinicola]